MSKLIAEEVRKKDSTRIEDETALHVGKRQEKKSFNKRSGSQRKTGSSVQCFNCGKRGHYARDCRKKKADNGERQDDHSNVAFNAIQGNTSDCWIMDSGATAHMCKDKDAFIDYTASPTVRNVKSAKNNASLKVLGQGTVVLRVWNGILWINARLENTLHVQDLNKNLFSLTAATARGMTVEINSDGCTVLKRANRRDRNAMWYA